ncbi:hypothetical protein ACROYT_G033497 [Oculina patagonica]
MKNVDEATYEWYQKARTKKIPVTGPMLQEKAKRASEKLGDSTFKASNGWLDRFKKRYERQIRSDQDCIFPPNSTSRLQPLDLGIIQTFKLKYMKLMLTHVVSKIDDCDSATDVCKSMDLLQAIRWIGQAWENVSESTVKKCFIKAGFLSADESLVSFPAEHREFDPFEDLETGELVQVNSLLCDASSGTSSDIPSAVEALEATSSLPTCKELSANWEVEFFSDLSASSSQDEDSDDDLIEVNSQAKEVKVKSMREAMTMLEDLTEFLTTENSTDTGNSLAKVLSNLQSAWLNRKLKVSVQSKVTDFFK